MVLSTKQSSLCTAKRKDEHGCGCRNSTATLSSVRTAFLWFCQLRRDLWQDIRRKARYLCDLGTDSQANDARTCVESLWVGCVLLTRITSDELSTYNGDMVATQYLTEKCSSSKSSIGLGDKIRFSQLAKEVQLFLVSIVRRNRRTRVIRHMYWDRYHDMTLPKNNPYNHVIVSIPFIKWLITTFLEATDIISYYVNSFSYFLRWMYWHLVRGINLDLLLQLWRIHDN